MKIWRVVTYTSLAVVLVCLGLVFSTPLRFPGYIIFSYDPIFIFLVPAATICALLVARLLVAHRPFSMLLISGAVIFVALTITRHMALVVFALSLIALATLFAVSRSIETSSSAA